MKTQTLVLVLLFGAPNFAAAQDLFATGVLGTQWGSTLQTIKEKYPKGFAWHGENRKRESIIYQVTGEFTLPGTTTPIRMVEFRFSMQNQLRSVALHFDPADADAALYDIANLLGQDYGTKDDIISRFFYWKPNRVSVAAFSLGLGEQYPWAHLVVAAHGARNSSTQ
jgi:hypothetical protein